MGIELPSFIRDELNSWSYDFEKALKTTATGPTKFAEEVAEKYQDLDKEYEFEDVQKAAKSVEAAWREHAKQLLQQYDKKKEVINTQRWAETVSHAKATFFRALTTALIGLVILGISWLAQCWDIQLPLRIATGM